MTDPVISVFSSAIRPEYWMEVYESFKSNKISFELIFVGDNPPDYELPLECYFIYSRVKPAQCWEIASRRAKGKYLMYISDDFVFSEGTLDQLYDLYYSLNDKNIMVSPQYNLDETLIENALDYRGLTMAVCGFMEKETYRSLGGIDRKFIALYWDLDIALRLYQIGGKVVEAKGIIAYEKSRKNSNRLLGNFGSEDKIFLDSLWEIENGKVKTRNMPFEGFSDKNILTISQGNKGRWT